MRNGLPVLLGLLCVGSACAQSSREQLGRTFTPHPAVAERPQPRSPRREGALPRAEVERAVQAADAQVADAPAEPGISADWAPEGLAALHLLRDRGIAVPLVDRFLASGGAFERAVRDGGPRVAYVAASRTLEVSSAYVDERGRWAANLDSAQLADLAAGVWEAYVHQVVGAGRDADTAAALSLTGRWLARAKRRVVKPAASRELFPLPAGFGPRPAPAEPFDVKRVAAGYATAVVGALARDADPRRLRNLRASAGGGAAVYEFAGSPPAELVRRLAHLVESGRQGVP